jgi:hypothetical protein
VGTILAHIGITPDKLMHEMGLSADHVQDYARRGFDRAWPNLLLGAMIIVPVWLLVYTCARRARAAANKLSHRHSGARAKRAKPE